MVVYVNANICQYPGRYMAESLNYSDTELVTTSRREHVLKKKNLTFLTFTEHLHIFVGQSHHHFPVGL